MSIFKVKKCVLFERDSLRALATVLVADAVWLTGLRVIEGKRGLFVTMPSRHDSKKNEYQDVYFPASKAHKDELQALVLEAYKKAKGDAPC